MAVTAVTENGVSLADEEKKLAEIKKKMSAPSCIMQEVQPRSRKLNTKMTIPVIAEEGITGFDENNNNNNNSAKITKSACSSAVNSDCEDDNVEFLRGNTNILPWNIVEDPPETNKKELYVVEGSWRLVANQNYDKYLSAIGVTPLTAKMVLRSDFMITIYEDIDKCWMIKTETSIKAKSIRGYRCRNYKMTSNKFMLNEPKPELIDDWDPRLVVTTVSFENEEDQPQRLIMDQQAEQDLKFRVSSRLTLEAPTADELLMTYETEVPAVRAVRRLVRHKPIDKLGGGLGGGSRKISAPF